jgi:hypothetical protein
MTRFLTVLTLVAATLGCANEGEVPQAVAVAMTAPQEAADKEVLIASQPAGAKILLKGAEVGATPMKLLIRGDTNVLLEKEGYVQQALMLTPKSDPNVVVTLVPAAGAAAAPPAEPGVAVAAADTGAAKGSGKSSGKKPGKADEKAGEPPAADAAGTGTGAPAVEPAPPPAPAPPPPPAKTEYTTMRQIKDALKAGKITKAEYSHWQGIIRQKREVEFEAAKKDLRDHKITEAQYDDRIRAIRLKYEG